MIRRSDSAPPLLRTPALRAVEQAAAGQPLMERAGAAAAAAAVSIRADRAAPVLVVAGPGNNGGDAFVVARLLRQRGLAVEVVFAGEPQRLPGDAGAAYAAFAAAGGTTLPAIAARRDWSLIVDGLFGIGLTRPPEGRFGELIATMNTAADASDCPLLALDCPSGLDADSGTTLGIAVCATHTLSFIAAKPGLLTGDGPDHCGSLDVAPLGLDVDAVLKNLPEDAENVGRLVSRGLFADWLLPRPRNSHKGSFGSAGILGGAPGMAGAALLAGRAALKLGSGRVFVGFAGTPPAVDPVQPELMLRSADGCLAAPLTALACGPGLGTDAAAERWLDAALATSLPLVLDADALTLIAADADRLARVAARLDARSAPTLLTPHPAEAARLLAGDVATIQRDRIAAARAIAARCRAWVALKGLGTVVAAPDGRWWLNGSGNPALATAGSGDVLTGLVVALLAQGWPAEPALLAAVHLHGHAAEALAAQLGGEIGATAGEIATSCRQVFNRWVSGG